VELKSVTASVYFSSDTANPDIASKFYADIQMYTLNMTQPDPTVFMRVFLPEEISAKVNKWQGRNITRWRNDDYDEAYRAAEGELDPIKRAALFIRMNDLVCDNVVVIPIVNRPKVQALSNKLHAPGSGWDNDLWNLKDWYRDA
jgi:peptide/nickel transport system substrate-binding protein